MQTLESLKDAVFKILTSRGTGSGFYLENYNVIVTNHHVIDGFKSVAIEDDNKNRILGKVIMTNPFLDIAILKIEKDLTGFRGVTLDDTLIPNTQQKVFALGYPFGMPFTITEGIVSNPSQHMDGKHFVQTDAAINPGNSGGPLVTADGKLVGISSSKFNNADNVGFAIPIKEVKEAIESALSNELNKFSLQCASCGSLSFDPQDFCNNCGNTLEKRIFEDLQLTDFSQFIEEAISQLDVNPILTRAGHEFWEFHQGSSQIRIFVMNRDYLYMTSPMNKLPKENLEALYKYIISSDHGDFNLGIYKNEIFISYRIHMTDIFIDDATKADVKNKLKELALKADKLDDFFANEYECDMSSYAKSS